MKKSFHLLALLVVAILGGCTTPSIEDAQALQRVVNEAEVTGGQLMYTRSKIDTVSPPGKAELRRKTANEAEESYTRIYNAVMGKPPGGQRRLADFVDALRSETPTDVSGPLRTFTSGVVEEHRKMNGIVQQLNRDLEQDAKDAKGLPLAAIVTLMLETLGAVDKFVAEDWKEQSDKRHRVAAMLAAIEMKPYNGLTPEKPTP